MADDDTMTSRLVEATLTLAADRGWRALTLAGVAAQADVGLADAYNAVPDRAALLSAMLAAVDRAVLAGGRAEEGDSPRDRLFEVLMRRFDHLQLHRDGYAAVLRDVLFDPPALLPTLPRFARSMAWMLEAAGLSSNGLLGNLRTQAVAALYLNTLRVWLDDDSVDLARTMASLDRGLHRVEEVVRRVPMLAGGARRSETAPEPDTSDAGSGDAASESDGNTSSSSS